VSKLSGSLPTITKTPSSLPMRPLPLRLLRSQIRHNSNTTAIHSGPLILKPPQISISRIIENYDDIQKNCQSRNLPQAAASLPEIVTLNKLRLHQLQQLTPLETRRNTITTQLPKTKEPIARKRLLEEALTLKTKISLLKNEQEVTMHRLLSLVSSLPNDLHPSTPSTETEIGKIGSLKDRKAIKDHVEIAEDLDILDLRTGAKSTGHAWYYLKGLGVRLELALVAYAIEMAIRKGWKLVKPPDVIRTEIALACGFRPRDEAGDQIYRLAHSPLGGVDSVKEEGSLCLAGTAEIPLAAMNMERTFTENELPLRYVGVGTAYRAEAGSRGKESKGLYRVHQFTKVELFAWTKPQESDEMLNEILELQKEVVDGLGLHARILDMPAHELGNAAYRKYDIEAWLPGRQGWGEITSASNCTDYQSRRLHTRYRPNDLDEKLQFAHTLNGTAIAVPRMIIAILENGLQEDGKVEIPEALRKYIGTDTIEPS
jgi:seryl-tRNA synthetase